MVLKKTISDVIISKANGKAISIIAVPIKNSENQLVGMLACNLDLDNFKNKISEIKLGESGYAFITDKTGTVFGRGVQLGLCHLQLQFVGDAAQHLGDLGRLLAVGVTAVPVPVAEAVEHLDQILHQHCHVLGLAALGLGERRRGLEHMQAQRLLALTPLDHTELDALPG